MTLQRAGSNPEPCEDDGWSRKVDCDGDKPHVRMIHHHCFNPICPRCARAWALRSAGRIAARVDGIKVMSGKYARHWMISPAQNVYIQEAMRVMDLASLRRAFVDVALEMGLHGGALVVHGWREHNRGKGDWYWSPHAHLIAWGYARRSSLPKGWEARSLSKVTPHGCLSAKEVAESIVAYELDHCAVEVGRASHTWFGSCSYAALRVVWVSHREASRCRECGADEHYYNEDGERHLLSVTVWYAHVQRRRGLKTRKRRSKWGGIAAQRRASN